ncbi:hypothetical protein ACJ2CR_28775 [Myxococcus faecalis]|jgi:hypothetical protein|uniref:hypothetical protein n=1 Tax=Myxococcus TaxID=32 RepID=UPI001CC1A882|nr:hypothetical protein [Myxococcus sp. XM-1-1-1]MBZ4413166.1 hypothetical protein [Myxococcus sp. XM-1-1-1]BDT38596.1 hypothetical protein MFMH1_82650 [Myxococcus sp. MH1]
MHLRHALPLVLLTSGCALEPETPVFLSGTVLETDGTPWRGGPLTLMRPRKLPGPRPLPGEPPTGQPTLAYEPWAQVTPDADGLFLHELSARDTGADLLERPTPWASLKNFQLHLPPVDGARDFLALHFVLDVDVPPLRRWDSRVQSHPDAAGVKLSWVDVPALADIPSHTYAVQARGEWGVVWTQDTRSGEAFLGPEMLEDFAPPFAYVQARARGQRSWIQSALEYTDVHEAPPVPLPFTGAVPVSRGQPCETDAVVDPCPFTDGKLESKRVPISRFGSLEDELVFRLREPTRPRRVLIRGHTGTRPQEVFHVEGSLEGGAWVALGQSAPAPELGDAPYTDDVNTQFSFERDVDIPLAGGAPLVDKVRVYSLGTVPGLPTPSRGYFTQLREVSVF